MNPPSAHDLEEISSPDGIHVAVGALAARVHRRGDLYPGLDGRTTAEEGIATQRALQKKIQQRPQQEGAADEAPAYETEVTVAATFMHAGLSIDVRGRIDGLQRTGHRWLVEEYKTTRADPELAHQHLHSEHWAQLRGYAALLAIANPKQTQWCLRLLYCHPDTQTAWTVEQQPSSAELLRWLATTITEYARWQHTQRQLAQARDRWIQTREFPFGSYRPHQRALATCVYQSIRDKQTLLLEAPTGSGKSLGVLFPALKALAQGAVQRYLFLTSRSTGAMAATQALQHLDPAQESLRWVQLRAKRVVCPVPGMPCRADQCDYAKGYYDRITGAVSDLLEHRAMPLETVAKVAEVHKVCPFELSLDAALWADVVIADYNYVFDPVARLLRFSQGTGLGLLIDEAHHLAPRASDMLSCEISRGQLNAAIAEAPPQPLTSRLRGINRALLKESGPLRHSPNNAGRSVVIDYPAALERSLQRFVDALAKLELDLASYPQTRELLFSTIRWLRLAELYDADRYRGIAAEQAGNLSVGFACLDPAPHVQETAQRFASDIRFSGTLTPLPLYAQLQGSHEARLERAGSPFDSAQLGAFIVSDIPTYWRQRTQSLGKLADLLQTLCQAQPGRYLVALPSFAYLNMLHEHLLTTTGLAPQLMQQVAGMDATEQSLFLQDFGQAQAAIGLVVLGGSFAESVDFADTQITGIVCVGVGIAPPSEIQTQRREYFDASGLDGERVAVRQPAMVKIVQMAGRLLRDPKDRGILCLVDDRFARAQYQEFFPVLWQPKVLAAKNMPRALAEFWKQD